MGTLVDESADMRDITASIVDLAVRGYIVIEEHTNERMMGLFKDKDYSFTVQQGPRRMAKLKPHEHFATERPVRAGTAAEYSFDARDLENQFYKNFRASRISIFESLVTHGYYKRRPDTVRSVLHRHGRSSVGC